MPNDTPRVKIITGRDRRRRYSAEQKLRLVEKTMQPGMTVSAVARLHGVSPRQRVRELERLLGRKTLKVEVLKEALAVARGTAK